MHCVDVYKLGQEAAEQPLARKGQTLFQKESTAGIYYYRKSGGDRRGLVWQEAVAVWYSVRSGQNLIF